MGMAKIPRMTSWAKITWQKKKKNEMTISKYNRKRKILPLLKLKDIKFFFIEDTEHSNPLLNSKQNMRIIKVQKSKLWGPSRWSLSPLCFLASLHVSFLIPQNPLHIILQPLLVTCSRVDVFRRNNVFRHPMTWPNFTNPTQDLISEHHSVEDTLIIRGSLMLSKLT